MKRATYVVCRPFVHSYYNNINYFSVRLLFFFFRGRINVEKLIMLNCFSYVMINNRYITIYEIAALKMRTAISVCAYCYGC